VYLSIIDFLQRWTMGKCAARVLKFAEWDQPTIPPAMYARRFHQHFTDHLVELPWHIGGASAPAADAQGPGGAPTGDELVKVDLAPSEATTSAPAVAEQDFSKDLSHNDSLPWQATSASVDVDQESPQKLDGTSDRVRPAVSSNKKPPKHNDKTERISAGSVESGPSGRTGRGVGGRGGG